MYVFLEPINSLLVPQMHMRGHVARIHHAFEQRPMVKQRQLVTHFYSDVALDLIALDIAGAGVDAVDLSE